MKKESILKKLENKGIDKDFLAKSIPDIKYLVTLDFNKNSIFEIVMVLLLITIKTYINIKNAGKSAGNK